MWLDWIEYLDPLHWPQHCQIDFVVRQQSEVGKSSLLRLHVGLWTVRIYHGLLLFWVLWMWTRIRSRAGTCTWRPSYVMMVLLRASRDGCWRTRPAWVHKFNCFFLPLLVPSLWCMSLIFWLGMDECDSWLTESFLLLPVVPHVNHSKLLEFAGFTEVGVCRQRSLG